MKNSSSYWKKRFELLEQNEFDQASSFRLNLEDHYMKAQREIEGQILSWYQRFANNNNISMAEARKWLTTKELAELKWDVKEYIKYGEENEINSIWMKQLENASTKYHISRLEALKIQTQQSLEVLFGNQLDNMDDLMKRIYSEGYYHTAYELQHGFNIGWDIANIDQRKLEKIISKPWAADGRNFSSRVWDNRSKLVNEVHNELTQMAITGRSPDQAINNIAKKMNTSKNNAGRLVMTESAYFSSVAQKDAFTDLDVEKFEIVATLDSRTSEICQDLDGKVFDIKDYEAGVTAPPFHVWCRTTTVPYFDDEFNLGERAARDEETGKTYYVPSNMTYPQWKSKFVDKDSKNGLTEIGNGDIINVASPTVSKVPDYNFNDGTSATKTKYIRNADVYTNSNNVKFVYPEGYDTSKQLIEPKRGINLFESLPDSLKSQIHTVEFLDYRNPQDSYWERVYKRKGFTSFATGSNGHITFWKNDVSSSAAMDDIWIKSTYAHEAAHTLDQVLGGNGTRISNSTFWNNIVMEDLKVSGRKSPTSYGLVHVNEDFADSIAEYLKDPISFEKEFPNRAKYFKGVL